GSARRGAARRAVPSLARRRGELRQHAAPAPPARVPAGAGHLRDLDGRVSPRVSRAWQARRLRGDLGERRAAPRGGCTRRLRCALRAVPLPARIAHVDPLHHAERLTMTSSMPSPLLPTAVVGSYSMPGWLERVKNDYLQRRISRHDYDEIH